MANTPQMLIYKVTNLVNGKVYVGQTAKGLKERWGHHLENALKFVKTARGNCPYLYNALRKYGAESFVCEELRRCRSVEELNKAERYWIRALDLTNPEKGYNISLGGRHHKLSPEGLERIRRGVAKRVLSLEARARIGRAVGERSRGNKYNLGKKHPGLNKGIPKSEECKRKLSEIGKAMSLRRKRNEHGQFA